MLDLQQVAAVNDCCDVTKRLVAVTGPAGSGKTSVIREVCARLRSLGISYAVCAPTGKAARRVKEATGEDALTIHRLLEYTRPGEPDAEGNVMYESYPRRDKHNPLAQQVVLADEYAMVGTELHRNLVSALRTGAGLRVFGDLAQLPPIEDRTLADEFKKSPFKRLLEMPHTHTFETVYRQAEGGDLLAAANKIRRGITPARSPNFMFKFSDRPVDALMTHIEDDGIDYRLLDNQIISPQRKAFIGTKALNAMVQTMFDRGTPSIELPIPPWAKGEDLTRPVVVAVGDKVVCTENTYDLRDHMERYAYFGPDGNADTSSYIPPPETKQMLNGEVGLLTTIHSDGGLEVDFGDRVVEIPSRVYELRQKGLTPIDPRVKLDLAYVLTTHKVQGSEFARVCYIINKSAHHLLSRKNFYTAITRARESAFVITDQRGWSRSLGNAE